MRLWGLIALVLGSFSALAPTAVLGAAPPTGFGRIAYFSPDGPAIDVYADGVKTLSNLAYKTVSSYQRFNAGNHTIDVRAAGASSSGAPLLSKVITISGGTYQTLAAAGKVAQLAAAVFDDGFSGPSTGKAEVRAIHLAPEVPAVDIAVRGGPIIFTNVAFPNATGYSPVSAGTYDLEFRATGKDTVLLVATDIAVKAGVVESLAGVGGVGHPIEVVAIPDAAAAVAVGGTGTGLGGSAWQWSRTGMSIEAMLLLVLLSAGLWTVRARRRALVGQRVSNN